MQRGFFDTRSCPLDIQGHKASYANVAVKNDIRILLSHYLTQSDKSFFRVFRNLIPLILCYN